MLSVKYKTLVFQAKYEELAAFYCSESEWYKGTENDSSEVEIKSYRLSVYQGEISG